MQWTIKVKLVLMGIAAIQVVAMLLFLSVKMNTDLARALSSGLEVSTDAPLVSDLRLAGKDLALVAIPSPAERRTQRYSGDRLAAFDRQLARIREYLGMLVSTKDESKRAGILLAPSRTLLALERKITLDLRRAVDSGVSEQEIMFTIEEIRALAGDLDGNFLALLPDAGEGPSGALDEIFEMLNSSTSIMFVNAAVGIVLVITLVAWLGLSITRPLAVLADRMTSLADGHTEVEIPGKDRHDEIGRMTKALQRIRETLAGSRRSR